MLTADQGNLSNLLFIWLITAVTINLQNHALYRTHKYAINVLPIPSKQEQILQSHQYACTCLQVIMKQNKNKKQNKKLCN